MMDAVVDEAAVEVHPRELGSKLLVERVEVKVCDVDAAGESRANAEDALEEDVVVLDELEAEDEFESYDQERSDPQVRGVVLSDL